MLTEKKTILVNDHLFQKKNFFNLNANIKKYNIVFNNKNKSFEKKDLRILLKLYPNTIGIIAGLEKYNRNSVEVKNNLKVISRVGVGLDSLDLKFLKSRKIKVLKLSNELTETVAELFFTLILLSLRKIIPNYNFLKKNLWKPVIGDNLRKKKIGIIGFGKIGKKLYKLLQKFDCKFYIFEKKKIKNILIKKYHIKTIFQKCDVVCLCLNLNDSTKSIINSKILKYANKEISIINASRGAILNEKDLYNFLKNNEKSTAFLDCFTKEPYKGKLIKLKNLFPLPHIASYTKDTRRNMELASSKKLIKYLDNIKKNI